MKHKSHILTLGRFVKTLLIPVSILTALFTSCEKDYLQRDVPPPPHVSEETATLEASFVSTAPDNVNASFWNNADYLNVSLQDLSKGLLYNDDGRLNATGTYKGLSGFDNQGDEKLTMKAAYDNDKLYLLIEWTDFSADGNRSSWLYDGPEDPLKSDSSQRWTSQRNDDKLSLIFDLASATGANGSFESIGCDAACHSGMKTQSGTADLWTWSLAETAPFGYALNMMVSDTGTSVDKASNMMRNANSASYRSGPMYEWDGTTQEVTNADGSTSVLDPAHYLVNKIAFEGDPEIGYQLYLNHTKGCAGCHGDHGEGNGPDGEGAAFTSPVFNRYSRDVIVERATADDHDGRTYFEKLSAAERVDLIARIRGFAGVPGYYFDSDVMVDQDIVSQSNVLLSKISEENSSYKVLLVRKLKTGNTTDTQFDPATEKTYPFGIALMHKDGPNHIGSKLETLTFLAK